MNWLKSTLIHTPDCHEDGKFLFKLGKASIHAGSYRHVDKKPYTLVINVSNSPDWEFPVEAKGNAGILCKEFVGPTKEVPAELIIEWRDGGAPKIRRKEWRKLLNDIVNIDGDIYIHCHGGHGRTGTLLVILASLGGIVPQGEDPVIWLRELYCKEIIESSAQIDYLKNNIGIKTKAEPRRYVHTYIGCKTDYSNVPTILAKEDTDLYKCTICLFSKASWFMKDKYTDMSGVCWRCSTSIQGQAFGGHI